MTKKHFIKLADYLRDTLGYCEPFTEKQINHLSNFCHAQNPAFNRQRWFDYIAGKCGPNGGLVKKTESGNLTGKKPNTKVSRTGADGKKYSFTVEHAPYRPKGLFSILLACTLGFLLCSTTLYAESLPVYDAGTSAQVSVINVNLASVGYARMFKAFDIAYALGANEVTFASPVTVMVGLIPVKAYAHITQFENYEPALWFEVFQPLRSYSDSLTLKQIETRLHNGY